MRRLQRIGALAVPTVAIAVAAESQIPGWLWLGAGAIVIPASEVVRHYRRRRSQGVAAAEGYAENQRMVDRLVELGVVNARVYVTRPEDRTHVRRQFSDMRSAGVLRFVPSVYVDAEVPEGEILVVDKRDLEAR